MSDNPNLDGRRGRGDILLSTVPRLFPLPYACSTSAKVSISGFFRFLPLRMRVQRTSFDKFSAASCVQMLGFARLRRSIKPFKS